MKNTENVITIAQKEFTDHIWSPRFLAFAITFTLIVFVVGYQKGLEVEYLGNVTGTDGVLRGFWGVARVVGSFAPIIGIVLGFDAIVKEVKSGSMNVLLTHPVFRDNIITGKIIGSAICLFLVLSISISISTGAMLTISGIPVGVEDIFRIGIFTILTFFYVLIFLAIGVIVSVIVKNSSNSLIYSIAIWLLFTILFSQIILSGIYISTGEMEDSVEKAAGLLNLAPGHHYAQLTMGENDVGWKGTLGGDSTVKGIFDTRFTLTQWFTEFWMNLMMLVVTPIILLIIAFITFLRKDITL
ncbi:MAG: ABC transporter permease [Methanosarcinales archaeon]|nr:ABC transporter permease [Methanosarcinales archaeon]